MSTYLTYNLFSEITSIVKQASSGLSIWSNGYTYDTHGNMLSSTDANGNTTNYTYNTAGLPTSKTDAKGNVYTYGYDSLNRPIQETDPLSDPTWTYDAASDVTSSTNANGVTANYSYDVMGRLLQETLPIDATTSAIYSYTYDAAGNLTSKTVPLSYSGSTLLTATSTYTYDGMNQLLTATDPLGNVTSYAYDANGNLTGVTDPLGNTTNYTYDADGNMLSQSVPVSGSGSTQVNAVTTYSVDADGNVTAVTDPLGRTTQYTYNTRDWVSSITDPLGNQTLYNYYDTGAVRDKTIQSVDGSSETWHYTYDNNGNLASVIDPVGNVTYYTYDANSNLLSVTGSNDGQGNFTYTYDAQNRRATSTDGAGDTTTYGYDPVGNLVSETDPLGNVTTYAYDDQNRLILSTSPIDGATSTTYNLAGWTTSVTDPNGNVTSYAYNADGTLSGETNPLGYSSSYVYNAAGEETGFTDFMGNQTQYTYNEAGWQTGESWLNSENEVTYQANYTYDLAGELTAAADNNSAYSYTYDLAGNMAQQAVTYPALSSEPLVTLSYANDGMGNRTSLSDSLGGQVTYAYTGGQLAQLGVSVDGVNTDMQLTFAYDNQGRAISVYTPSNVFWQQISYDGANRVTEMNYGTMSGLDLTYTYNAGGEVTSFTGPQGTVNFNYDSASQLTGVSGAQTGTYTYDANGNRTMTGYVTGPDNELLSDGTFTYTYNHNGQLATKTDASGNVWTYTWDNRGRLAEVAETDSGGTTVMDEKLVYDVNNNLIGTILNGTPQGWTVWDGKNPYLAFDGAGNLTQRYITDPRTVNAFFGQVSAAGQTEFYLTDQEHSVLMVLDASGNVLDQIAYDAYGNIVSQTNSANASAYLFQGGALDANLGLYHFGARWYDPNGGRWISQDPMSFAAGDSNLYRFVSNSPTNAIDPSGLDGEFGFGTVFGALLEGASDASDRAWDIWTGNIFTNNDFYLTNSRAEYIRNYGYGSYYTVNTLVSLGGLSIILAGGIAALPGGSALTVGEAWTAAKVWFTGGCALAATKTDPSKVGGAGDLFVIGHGDDPFFATGALDWPGHIVLNDPNWGLPANDAWIQSAIDQNATVFVASSLRGNLIDPDTGRPTVFARELAQFFQAGYIWIGDYLMPPNAR